MIIILTNASITIHTVAIYMRIKTNLYNNITYNYMKINYLKIIIYYIIIIMIYMYVYIYIIIIYIYHLQKLTH